MLACPFCEQVVVDGTCVCASDARVELNKNGIILAMHGGHGFRCQSCGADDQDLALRLYKRVVGLFFMDRVHSTGGYFCKSCRRKQFGKHMGLTLILGWWGILAMFFRNPWAIMANFRALLGPPVVPQDYGGLALRTVYPTDAEIQFEQDVTSGKVEDTWHCKLCDGYIVGHNEALAHADKGHQGVSLKHAKAALEPVTNQPTAAD